MQQLVERRKSNSMRRTGIELDLVIPALNEERRIAATIEAIGRKVEESGLAVRILVVDNGSVDATPEVASGMLDSNVPIEVISCRTRGKGAAVRAGVLRSTAPFVGYCDADLSTPPSAVTSGVDLLRSGWEVVIGSRRCTGAGYSVPQGGLRRLGSFAFRTMAADLSGPITDTQCGFKLFHAPVAKHLFEESRTDGFAFDVEVLAVAHERNHRMIELPIQWTDSAESTFRPVTDGIQSFKDLRRLRHQLATGAHRPAGWK
jgi:dolichyl-phosphate beta-glucosyltransferase